MITLRADQASMVGAIRQAFREGKTAPLLQSPTGSGKTCIFSYIAQSMYAQGKHVLIICHRYELLDQISEILDRFSVPHGFVASGRPFFSHTMVQVCSVQTLVRRTQYLPQPQLLIIDEAHHCTRKSSWGQVLEAFPGVPRLGVTATPTRLSGEALGDMFDCLLLGPSVRELIDQGTLADYRLFAPLAPVMEDVHSRFGDYIPGELSACLDKPQLIGDAVATYKQRAEGKRAVVFCVSVEHAHHVAEVFTAAGFNAAVLDGKLDIVERRLRVLRFRTGQLQILTSCEIINEGFDVPDIECGIFLRPTQSLTLWLQQVGRCLRASPGKSEAILLDHANNSMRHGLPDEIRKWTLDGSEEVSRGTREASVRQCKRCYAVVPQFAEKCRYCGFAFEIKARKVEQVEGELQEVDRRAERIARGREQRQASSYAALLEIERRRGYKPGWAKHVYSARKYANSKHGMNKANADWYRSAGEKE